jgi:hypothetical protein
MYLKQKLFSNMFFLWVALMALTISADVSKIQELEVYREDEDTGKSIFTIHILPGETRKFDKIEYEITYHQAFLFEDSRGRKYNKIHDPAVFKYARKKVKLVEALDHYVNFRIPISRERLKVIYGKLAFHPKHPITIPTIKIKAYDDDELVWEHIVKVNKAYIWDEKQQTLILKPVKKKKQTKN